MRITLNLKKQISSYKIQLLSKPIKINKKKLSENFYSSFHAHNPFSNLKNINKVKLLLKKS